MKTILAAIDFSPVTRRVLAHSVTLARALDLRVVVVNATALPTYIPEDYGFAVVADTTTALRHHALKELRRIERELRTRAASLKTYHAVGHPAEVVLACAKKFRADLIVIGSHGHTALYDLVVGSTAHVILKRATCPVLVVPSAPTAKTRKSTKATGASPGKS